MKIYNLAFLFLIVYAFVFPITGTRQKLTERKTAATDLVFKSVDGGQSWQDISEGLPENWEGRTVFANEGGLYISAGTQIYHNMPSSTAPVWEKETFPGKNSYIAPGNTGIFAFNWDGQFIQKIYGTNMWSPILRDFRIYEIGTVFETTAGTLLAGTDYCLYRSADTGKTWKQVYVGGMVMKLVESNNVLMAISKDGIIRSTDDGENWNTVLGGFSIAIEPIKGGFAAVSYNANIKARAVRASYDCGKTWESIDAGLPADLRTASIVQVGDDFFCGHPAGIFKSSDKGKTWKLLLRSVNDKVFNLFVSGNTIYAIPRPGGC